MLSSTLQRTKLLLQQSARSSYSTSTRMPPPLSDQLRETMRRTSQPVSVVSVSIPSSKTNSSKEHNHGATLSSLSSVSLKPPIIAFSIRTPSRLATFLSSTSSSKPQLVVNLLSGKQMEVAQVFSRQPLEKYSYYNSLEISELWKQSIEQGHEFPPLAFQSLKEDSMARLNCEIISFTSLRELAGEEDELDEDGGKGSILFLAKVKEIEGGTVERSAGALAYYEGEYATVSVHH